MVFHSGGGMAVPGRTRQALSLVFLAVLAAASWAASAPSPAPSSGPSKSTQGATVKRPSKGQADLPAGGPLPDSVLAVIDDQRIITAGDFRRGWGAVLPPSRPDTLTPQ